MTEITAKLSTALADRYCVMSVARVLCVSSIIPFGLVGQTPSAEPWVDTLQAIIEREVQNKDLLSFALVVTTPTDVLADVAIGYRTLDRREPVGSATIYRTGSVGKTITDLAVMRAVEDGLVDLDVDVRTYLTDFRPQNEFGGTITLRQLIMHTAGLVREPPIGHYFDDSGPTLRQTVASLNGTSLLTAPGTRTKYSNAGLAVVGAVLESAYEQSYTDVVSQLVFQPAGMTSTRVGFDAEIAGRLAHGVMWWPDSTVWTAPIFDLGYSPAGDLYASTGDMARLMARLLNGGGGIVDSGTFQAMVTPYPPRSRWQIDVGIGFSLNGTFGNGYRMARNGGAVYGYATELALLPEEGLGVYAVATRDMSNGTVRSIAHWALEAAMAHRAGEALPSYNLTAAPFEDLPGTMAGCSTEGATHLGAYGWDHSPLILCERDGVLHALIEAFFFSSLIERGDGVFSFPSYALYSSEELRFERDEAGDIVAAVIGYGDTGIRFPRR